jgi:hypothetical protein
VTRFETIVEEEKYFHRWLAEDRAIILTPEPLVPTSDRSVLFTNSAVTSFKPFLAGACELPDTPIGVIQPCVRVQNLDYTFGPDFNGDFVLVFAMFGVMASATHAAEFIASSQQYLQSVLPAGNSKILFKAHPGDKKLIDLWLSSGGKRESLLLGTEPDPYYQWRFGLSNVSGSGATYSIRQSDGRIRDLGNLMEFRLRGEVLGYGVGFGVETLVACKSSARWVIDCVPVAEILPIQNEQEAKCADLVTLVTTLIHGGITFGRRGQGFILRKACRQLVTMSERVGWSKDTVVDAMNQLEQTMWNAPPTTARRAAGTVASEWSAPLLRPAEREKFDLSFFVPEKTVPEHVAECVRELTDHGVDNVKVFDVYHSQTSLQEISVGITVQHVCIFPSKQVMAAAVSAVTIKLNGRLRGAI